MLEHILDGGPMMIPLLGVSVLAVAVIIDRVRAFRTAEVDTPALRQEVTEHMEKGNIDEAIQACERYKGPVAAVLMVGLLKFRKMVNRGKPLNEIESHVSKTMSDYAPHMVEALEKRLNLLTMIASVSPLLGMTGTVTGMIASFEGLAEAGGLEGGAVAGGISEALVTTASGLIIAIPAVVAHTVFSKKVDRFTLEMDESGTQLLDVIALQYVTEE